MQSDIAAHWSSMHTYKVSRLTPIRHPRVDGLRLKNPLPVIDEQGRMCGHMWFFVNNEQVFDLNHVLRANDEVFLVQALSGG